MKNKIFIYFIKRHLTYPTSQLNVMFHEICIEFYFKKMLQKTKMIK